MSWTIVYRPLSSGDVDAEADRGRSVFLLVVGDLECRYEGDCNLEICGFT